jgi:Fe-S cluster assembly protein SufD
MSQVADRLDTYAAAFDAFRKDRAFGAGEFADARVAAFGRFKARGFPTTRDEEWRFTNVAPIAAAAFSPAASAAPSRADVEPFLIGGADVHELVVVNGRLAPALCSPGVPKGAKFNTGSREESGGQREGVTPFVDLNTAFFAAELVIDVAAKAVVPMPIHVLYLTVAEGAPVMTSPRLSIRIGEQAQATIIESYACLSDTGSFTNAVTDVTVAASGVLDHVKLQREPRQTFHLAAMTVETARAGVFRSHAITLGGRIARNDIHSRLVGEGAECTLNGLYVADGDTLVDTHTTIDHTEPHCPSHEVYKGILSGRSKAVFNGKIIVRQKAQKTDAKQTNKALLLSDDSQINTKPQLEIFADDVKCTHGATIGQLDDDQMFYLRARGIARPEARNMLIHAFAGDVLNGIRVEPVRELALRLVDEKLSI